MTKQIITSGNQKHILTDKNYLTAGGEAEIYVKDNLAFKLYFKNKVTAGLKTKVKELSPLASKDNIIAPKDLFFDANSRELLGYYMTYLKSTEQLNKLFTKSYKSRNNIGQEDLLSYISCMIDTISFIHSKGIVMVDGNEYNYLFSKTSKDVYFIDVDSYQTKSFPAKVIMPSIRDYHTKGFTSLTDWYSFAIVSFQMLMNIHPFKGSHPDYTKKQLEERMLKNISVFDSRVTLPKASEDIGTLPKALREWYRKLFKEGKRILPPSDIQGSGEVTAKETYITEGHKQLVCLNWSGVGEKDRSLLEYKGANYKVTIEKENLILTKVVRSPSKVFTFPMVDIEAYQIIDNRLFVVLQNKFIEVDFIGKDNLPEKIITRSYYEVLPNKKMFDGVLTYESFQKYFFVIPVPEGIIVKQFNDILPKERKIFDVKFFKGILQIISNDRAGKFYLTLFHIDRSKEAYTEELSSPTETNFIVLDSGVVVCYNTESLIITHTAKSVYKIVEKVKLPPDMVLYSEGENVLFTYRQSNYQIKLK